jgi:hypothetical protein
MGCVTVEVALPGDEAEVVSATGTIAQVSALLYVADAAAGDDAVTAWRLRRVGIQHGCVSAAALAALLGVPEAEAAGLLRFWVRKRVLVEADALDGDVAGQASSSSAAARKATVFMVRGGSSDRQHRVAAGVGEAASDALGGSASGAAEAVTGTDAGRQDHGMGEDEDEEEQDVVGAAMLAQQTALVRNFGIGMMRSRGAMRLQDILVTLRTFASCE